MQAAVVEPAEVLDSSWLWVRQTRPSTSSVLTQLLDLLPLLAAQLVTTRAAIGFGVADVSARRLGVDPKIASRVRDRPPSLERQPRTPRSINSGVYFLEIGIPEGSSSPRTNPRIGASVKPARLIPPPWRRPIRSPPAPTRSPAQSPPYAPIHHRRPPRTGTRINACDAPRRRRARGCIRPRHSPHPTPHNVRAMACPTAPHGAFSERWRGCISRPAVPAPQQARPPKPAPPFTTAHWRARQELWPTSINGLPRRSSRQAGRPASWGSLSRAKPPTPRRALPH